MDEVIQPVKRRGRPPKNLQPKAEPKVEAKAVPKDWGIDGADWDSNTVSADEAVDRYALPKWFLEKWSNPKDPSSASFRWVMDSILGQQDPHWRSKAEMAGWRPVTQRSFNGELNGLFMRKDAPGEINVDGLVLMVRPMGMTEKARLKEKRAAHEQVLIKEQAWRAGEIPVTLDSQHPTAVNTNRINKSYERIEVPEK